MRTEDGHIVRECLDGDSASFGLLVDKYKASIYALAYSRLHNFHDAEDVTQDVFLKAYRNLRSLRRWDSFLVWLRSITINLCKDRIRTQSRRPDREFIEDQRPEALKEISLDPRSDEDALTAREEMLDSLDKALDSLPEIYQQVLMLHYLGGMSGEQISQFLGISHATVRQRLSRARKQLREEVLATMNATFEENILRADFTFRIVEAVKRIRIHPVSDSRGLPFGLSMATGIILAILIANPRLTVPEYIGIPVNSPLPSEAKALRVGEIPVDVMKVSKAPFISSGQNQGNGGKPKLPDPQEQNAIFLAPQGEGDTWTRKADMPTGSWGLSTAVMDGKIYAFGGCRIRMDEYDPETDTWITKEFDDDHHPIEPAVIPSISAVDRIIYIIGGIRPDDTLISSAQAYGPVTNEYMKKADIPTPRYYLSSSVVNGKIYAIGGWNNVAVLSATEEYDPATDTWIEKADMPTARFSLSTSVVNGKIYAIGGGTIAEEPLPTVEEYDPATDTWRKRADMPTARYGLATCVLDGKIYAIGGRVKSNPKTVTSMVEVYDPVTDTWTEGVDMVVPRDLLSASVINGKIYAIGGWNPNMAPPTLSTVEEYTPEGLSSQQLVSPKDKLPTTWGEVKSD